MAFHIKARRKELWQEIVPQATDGIVVVGAMIAWVKWRAGEIGGYAGALLRQLDIALFCMEEYESYDVHQVFAAMSNLPVKTLLMAGDIHQRVEPGRRSGQRANFDQTPTIQQFTNTQAWQLAPYGLGEDGEEYSTKAMGIIRHGQEVGWHTLLYESICHAIVGDLYEYKRKHFFMENKTSHTQRFLSSCP